MCVGRPPASGTQMPPLAAARIAAARCRYVTLRELPTLSISCMYLHMHARKGRGRLSYCFSSKSSSSSSSSSKTIRSSKPDSNRDAIDPAGRD
eukprot:234280-Chlamydomonas_euryale.AAC.1